MAVSEESLNLDLNSFRNMNSYCQLSAFNQFKEVEYVIKEKYLQNSKQYVSIYLKDKENVVPVCQDYLIQRFKSFGNESYKKLADEMQQFEDEFTTIKNQLSQLDINNNQNNQQQQQFQQNQKYKDIEINNIKLKDISQQSLLNGNLYENDGLQQKSIIVQNMFNRHNGHPVVILQTSKNNPCGYLVNVESMHYNEQFLNKLGWDIDEYAMKSLQEKQIIETFFPNNQLQNIYKWFQGLKNSLSDQIQKNQENFQPYSGNIIYHQDKTENVGKSNNNQYPEDIWQPGKNVYKGNQKVMSMEFFREFYAVGSQVYIILVQKS